MRAMSSALRVPPPKPGTGACTSSIGRPILSASAQDEGKLSDAAASRQPAGARRISTRSSCTSRAAVQSGGAPSASGTTRPGAMCMASPSRR